MTKTYLGISMLLALLLLGCRSEDERRLTEPFPVGSILSSAAFEESNVVLDFRYDVPGNGAPLRISLHGYSNSRRPLEKSERLLVIGSEDDLVVFIYLSKEDVILDVEIHGS